MSSIRAAEALLRRFARDTNLLIAGRPMRVIGDGAVAEALTTMLTGMGARIVTDHEHDGLVDFDVEHSTITLNGAPLPARADAEARVDFARSHMPVSQAIATEIADAGTVEDVSIGLSLTLEPKTATLALLLAEAGARVAVWSHPDETDPAVAEVLRARGVPVDADATLTRDQERDAALGFLGRGFDVLVDDGSHLTRLALEEGLTSAWIGATEETTSGLTPLRAMEADGALPLPVIAVNDAATKTGFDNRYGTGQSCVLAIADLLEQVDITVRDQPALVIGYGPVGAGVAAHLRALGAQVRVAERDPVRALLAAHDGYTVGPALELAADALVVSATGVAGTVTVPMLAVARAVAVAGGVPGEVAWSADPSDLASLAPHVDRHRASGAILLDRGGCINVTAAEGNPVEIMDLSFATQLAALAELLTTRPDPGVHPLSDAAVDQVAAAAVRARGIVLDAPDAGARDARSADARSQPWRRHRFSPPEAP